MGGRHYYLAKELTRQGYDVHVIAAAYTHLLRNPPSFSGKQKFEVEDGVSYVWLRMPRYKAAHSKWRIFNWFLFSWHLRRLVKIMPQRPDAILCSSLSLISFLGSFFLSKKLNAKLIFEVRDIWPLTAVELGGYSSRHPFIKFLQWVEDFAYRHSDSVISNLPNAVEHMGSRGMDCSKFTWIPNGFSLSEVDKAQPLSVEISSLLPKGKFIVGYAGTIGFANALDVLLEAANLLMKFSEIVIVLVGDGGEKKRLQSIADGRGISNLIFINSIPKIQVQSMLSQFSVCYIGWRKDPLYKFGISPNKISEYMYAAKPIIHSYSGFGDAVGNCGAGITVPAEDPAAVADAILKLYRAGISQRDEMGKKGRDHAIANYEYGTLAAQLGVVLEK